MSKPHLDWLAERVISVLRVGMEERPVASERASVRTWASLATVAGWLKRLGVSGASIRIQ